MKQNGKQLLIACALMVLASASVQAQVYRITGPDGRITYSDKPPVESNKPSAAPRSTGGTASAGAGLPFELRQVASRYPVTLYTAPSCDPCGSARALLTSRGVPFSERTVSTNEDGVALQRLAGDNVLPFVTIGGQQIKGFSDGEWSQFLDAAGYPKASALPASYRNPPATPLVAMQRPDAPAVAAPQQAARPVAPPPTSAADNPAGIRF
jgi:glutaredoxin